MPTYQTQPTPEQIQIRAIYLLRCKTKKRAHDKILIGTFGESDTARIAYEYRAAFFAHKNALKAFKDCKFPLPLKIHRRERER